MNIQEHFQLKPYNTFNIEAKCDYFVEIGSMEDVQAFFDSGLKDKSPRLILGGGSNVLFTKDFNGVVLHSKIETVEVVEENVREVLVKAGSGMEWDSFVAYCVERNWGGVENLSDIPGNVGAAPVQNIGAYGVEAKDTVFKVEAIDLNSGEKVELLNVDCKFGYRSSIFKQDGYKNLFVAHVVFKLQKQPVLNTNYGKIEEELAKCPEKNIRNVREAIMNIRQSKLPSVKEFGSAGSFFKNPVVVQEIFEAIQKDYPEMPFYRVEGDMVKIPAAWLIETAGLKDFKMGNVATFKTQPLVIINNGNAQGKEVVALSEHIQQSVREKFKIELQPEVCFV